MRPDIAEFMPLESTVDVLEVGSEVVEVDVEAEDDASSGAAVWLDAELLWLCIVWWCEWVLSETDKGISAGRWFDDASPFGDGTRFGSPGLGGTTFDVGHFPTILIRLRGR